jgi:hypothetical protein
MFLCTIFLRMENRKRGISGNNSDNNSRPAGRQAHGAANQGTSSYVDSTRSEESKLQPKRRKPRQKISGTRPAGIFFLSGEITRPQVRAARNNMRSGDSLRDKYP